MSLYHLRTQHTGGHQELGKGIIAVGQVSCSHALKLEFLSSNLWHVYAVKPPICSKLM